MFEFISTQFRHTHFKTKFKQKFTNRTTMPTATKQHEITPTNTKNTNQFATAFFLDTGIRQFRLPKHENLPRILMKLFTLLLNVLWLDLIYRYYDDYDNPRRYILSFHTVVFITRLTIQMAFVWNRAITYKEIIFEGALLTPVSISSFAYFSINNHKYIENYDNLGVILFLVGTLLNIIPEIERTIWKNKVINKGKLFKQSFFQHARHINYTGEIVSFVGFAMNTGSWLSLWVPVVMLVGVVFFLIDELEFYLKMKYGGEFERWCEEVPWVMVPGVY